MLKIKFDMYFGVIRYKNVVQSYIFYTKLANKITKKLCFNVFFM